MRRKSERAKASPSTKQSESVPRRTTRRNKKSPEKSITEEDSDNSSDQGVNSDVEQSTDVASTPKRGKRAGRFGATAAAAAAATTATAAEKSTLVEEVKERTTRGKRNTSVVSSETIDDENVSTETDTLQPDESEEQQQHTIDKENLSKQVDDDDAEQQQQQQSDARGHDNGDDNNIETIEPAGKEDGGDKSVISEDVDDGASADADRMDIVDAGDNSVAANDDKRTDDAGDVNSAVDVGVVVEDSTTTSESLIIHENVLNDFSEEANVTAPTSKKATASVAALDDVDADRSNGNSSSKETETHDDDVDVAHNNNKKKGDNIITTTTTIDGDSDNEADKQKSIVPKPVRKRKWLSSKQTTVRTDEIAISSDSLNALIPNVKPILLNEINLDVNSEPENDESGNEIESDTESDEPITATRTSTLDISAASLNRSDERIVTAAPSTPLIEQVATSAAVSLASAQRKVSMMPAEGRPPSPPKHSPSRILYITNLVRPFTLVQLRGLLARTGKIVENGFWMDKIKSKCYVKFETEE